MMRRVMRRMVWRMMWRVMGRVMRRVGGVVMVMVIVVVDSCSGCLLAVVGVLSHMVLVVGFALCHHGADKVAVQGLVDCFVVQLSLSSLMVHLVPMSLPCHMSVIVVGHVDSGTTE